MRCHDEIQSSSEVKKERKGDGSIVLTNYHEININESILPEINGTHKQSRIYCVLSLCTRLHNWPNTHNTQQQMSAIIVSQR